MVRTPSQIARIRNQDLLAKRVAKYALVKYRVRKNPTIFASVRAHTIKLPRATIDDTRDAMRTAILAANVRLTLLVRAGLAYAQPPTYNQSDLRYGIALTGRNRGVRGKSAKIYLSSPLVANPTSFQASANAWLQGLATADDSKGYTTFLITSASILVYQVKKPNAPVKTANRKPKKRSSNRYRKRKLVAHNSGLRGSKRRHNNSRKKSTQSRQKPAKKRATKRKR